MIEHICTDEPAGPVPASAQDFGKRGEFVADIKAGVVPHAVERRKGPGHQRCVCRQRKGRHGGGLLEPKPSRRQGIHRGSGCGCVAIGANPIRSKRVDADKQNRGCASRACRTRPAVLPCKPRSANPRDRDDHRRIPPHRRYRINDAGTEVVVPGVDSHASSRHSPTRSSQAFTIQADTHTWV